MKTYFYHHDHLKRYLSSKMAVFFPAMVGLAILFGISIVSSSAATDLNSFEMEAEGSYSRKGRGHEDSSAVPGRLCSQALCSSSSRQVLFAKRTDRVIREKEARNHQHYSRQPYFHNSAGKLADDGESTNLFGADQTRH